MRVSHGECRTSKTDFNFAAMQGCCNAQCSGLSNGLCNLFFCLQRTAMLAAGSAMKPFFLRTTSTDKASDPSVCYFGRIFVGGPAGGSFSRDPHLFLLVRWV